MENVGPRSDRDEIARGLSDFYKKTGTSVDAFCCPKFDACARAQGSDLWQGSEAHVGHRYGEPVPVVVVSLDRGERSQNLLDRTSAIEGLGTPTNPHMRGTRELLRALLPEVADSDIWHHFAMLNSAKCACRDGRMDSVVRELYWNCAEFTLGELEVLRPRIIVTQGKNARICLEQTTPTSVTGEQAGCLLARHADRYSERLAATISALINEHLRLVSLPSGHRSVWVCSAPHPSDRWGRWRFFRDCHLPIVSAFARDLVPLL
jgi:hypothetical protein